MSQHFVAEGNLDCKAYIYALDLVRSLTSCNDYLDFDEVRSDYSSANLSDSGSGLEALCEQVWSEQEQVIATNMVRYKWVIMDPSDIKMVVGQPTYRIEQVPVSLSI